MTSFANYKLIGCGGGGGVFYRDKKILKKKRSLKMATPTRFENQYKLKNLGLRSPVGATRESQLRGDSRL